MCHRTIHTLWSVLLLLSRVTVLEVYAPSKRYPEAFRETFPFPNNDLSHPLCLISLGLNKCCEDSFDGLGAAGSEIVIISDQFIHLFHNLFRQQQLRSSL